MFGPTDPAARPPSSGTALALVAVAAASLVGILAYSTAFMIFMVLIGGIGTIEGPILGAVIYFFMDLYFSQLGLWYLVVLAAIGLRFYREFALSWFGVAL